MAQVPTVPGSEMVNTPNSGVKRDFDALNAPNRANMQLASTVGDIGEQIGAFGMKLQAAKNYGIQLSADSKMREAFADFQLSRQGRTDEESWASEWKDRAQEVRSDVYAEHGVNSPILKRQLDNNFNTWESATGIEVKMLANKTAIVRGQERLQNNLDISAQQLDRTGDAEAKIDEAVRLGYYHPEQGAIMKKDYGRKVEQAAVKNGIIADPFATYADLQAKTKDGEYEHFKNLTIDERLTLGFEAHREMVAERTSTAADFFQKQQDFIQGEGPAIDPNEVRIAVARGSLTAPQARALLKPPKTEYNPAKFAPLIRDIAGYDPAEDGDKTKFAELVQRAAYDPEIKGPAATEAMSMLREKGDPKSSLNTPVAKGVLAQMRQDRIYNGAFIPEGVTETTTHWFKPDETKTKHVDGGLNNLAKMSDAEIKDIYGPEATLRSVQSAEQVHFAQQITKMRAWLKENPKATEDDAEEYRQGLIAPFILSQASRSVGRAVAPVVITSKEDFDALPQGAPFVYKGRSGTKN